MNIYQANRNDARGLTQLTLQSKDYWGYGKVQIEKWRDELTITPEYIENNEVFKLIHNRELTGFYAYKKIDEHLIKLNYLFVHPNFIGKGYGKKLMINFLERIDKSNCRIISLDADPNAEAFYTSFGFKTTGKLKSSIKDRYLPIMEFKIN